MDQFSLEEKISFVKIFFANFAQRQTSMRIYTFDYYSIYWLIDSFDLKYFIL